MTEDHAHFPGSTSAGWPPERASGVLLHPTALPGGRLGKAAYDFVDWLVAAGQTFWQVLPLGPPDGHGSPYASLSAFACWSGLLADPDAHVTEAEARAYREANAYWLDDWVAFCGGDGAVIADQVRFDREWGALRRYANERGVAIVGDLPIYVARASADTVAHPEVFERSRAAGVPPDFFSATGQLWGNPTYRWGALAADGYRWWIERFRRTLHLFDATRVDHFRGFVAYWAVPARAKTAKAGRWHRGPGRKLFDAVQAELGPLPLIAEDLGVITPPVHRLRDEIGALGIHVLQFGFGSLRSSDHPRNHRERSAVYTGTHDNPPAAAWWASCDDRTRSLVEEAMAAAQIVEREPAWALVELAQSSRGRLAVVQAQDLLGLGADARMNHPGTVGGNWVWRLERGALDAGLARRLRDAAARHGRVTGR